MVCPRSTACWWCTPTWKARATSRSPGYFGVRSAQSRGGCPGPATCCEFGSVGAATTRTRSDIDGDDSPGEWSDEIESVLSAPDSSGSIVGRTEFAPGTRLRRPPLPVADNGSLTSVAGSPFPSGGFSPQCTGLSNDDVQVVVNHDQTTDHPATLRWPGRAAGLLGRPADDRRSGRDGPGTGTSTDRLERHLDLIRGSCQFGALGDHKAAAVVVELRPAEQGPPAAVGRPSAILVTARSRCEIGKGQDGQINTRDGSDSYRGRPR